MLLLDLAFKQPGRYGPAGSSSGALAFEREVLPTIHPALKQLQSAEVGQHKPTREDLVSGPVQWPRNSNQNHFQQECGAPVGQMVAVLR